MEVNSLKGLLTLRSYQLFLTLDSWFQQIVFCFFFCFRGQQTEHEDDMFYEEDEIYGEEHEEWPCLDW